MDTVKKKNCINRKNFKFYYWIQGSDLFNKYLTHQGVWSLFFLLTIVTTLAQNRQF